MKKKRYYPSWFKIKHYLHLTPKISKNHFYSVYYYVNNIKKVEKHAFYPLLHYKIIQRRYKKVNNRRENKQKTTAKIRPIHYATHLDAHIYAFYAYPQNPNLGKLYEDILKENLDLSRCVTAYRKVDSPRKKRGKQINKCNIDFANDVFDFIAKQDECFALTFDIKQFFSSMNHEYLKLSWANLLKKDKLPPDQYNIFKSLTQFSYIDEQKLIKILNFKSKKKINRLNRKNKLISLFKSPKHFRDTIRQNKGLIKTNPFKYKKNNIWNIEPGTLKGIPQGTPISTFLANLYLLKFDKIIFKKVCVENNGLYRRYSDDIIVVCKKDSVQDIEKTILEEIKKCFLEINEKKTERFLFKKNSRNYLEVNKLINKKYKSNVPLTYLGFEFYGNKTLIKSQSLAKYYRKLKKIIALKAKRAGMTKRGSRKQRAQSFLRYRKKRNSMRANKSHLINKGIFKKKVYKKYSHLGRRNFISYAYRAASGELMNEKAIKRQIRNHWKNLVKEIQKYEYSETEVSKQIQKILDLYS